MLFRMEFVPTDESAQEEAADLIYRFLRTLEDSGRITDGFELVKQRHYTAIFDAPGRKALAEEWDSAKTVRIRRALAGRFELRLTAMGKSPLRKGICTCGRRKWLVLSVRCDDRDSPLTCGICGQAVPLYEIAGPDELPEIRTWQQNYKAVHRLRVNGAGGDWARRQLCEVDSELNAQGRAIALSLKARLGVPVCCEIFASSRDETHFACPVCGKPLIWWWGDAGAMLCEFCALCYER